MDFEIWKSLWKKRPPAATSKIVQDFANAWFSYGLKLVRRIFHLKYHSSIKWVFVRWIFNTIVHPAWDSSQIQTLPTKFNVCANKWGRRIFLDFSVKRMYSKSIQWLEGKETSHDRKNRRSDILCSWNIIFDKLKKRSYFLKLLGNCISEVGLFLSYDRRLGK